MNNTNGNMICFLLLKMRSRPYLNGPLFSVPFLAPKTLGPEIPFFVFYKLPLLTISHGLHSPSVLIEMQAIPFPSSRPVL